MAKYKVKDGKSITMGGTVKGPGSKLPEDAAEEIIERLLRLDAIEIDNSDAEAKAKANGDVNPYAGKSAKELKKIAADKGIEYDKNASTEIMLKLLSDNDADDTGDNE